MFKLMNAVTLFAPCVQFERSESIPEAGTVKESSEEDTEREDKLFPQALWGETADPGSLLQSSDKLPYQKQVQSAWHCNLYEIT